MSELLDIGRKIKIAIDAVWDIGLTEDDLDVFEAYISQQETIAPILNPNFIQKQGFVPFDKARKRIKLLKQILKLREEK